MKKDLTQGNLLKNIITFTIPFLLSYFSQTLYGMADLFIVGQYNGASSISGVSIGSQIMHMITVMLVGLSMGSIVMIARYVGSKDEASTNKVIGNSITVFTCLSIILLVILLFFVTPIVSLMQTPLDAIEETATYLRICFIGIPFIIAYNVIASIFKGLGDSKTPMYFIAIACIANIALDYLFIGYFDMHARGAAYGTILAQAISVICSLFAIYKKKMLVLQKQDFILDKRFFIPVLKTGIPVCLQDGFIQISFLIITIIANSRGVEVSAAVGIVEKIMSFMFLVPSSMMSTVSTISAQAFGANKKDIARKTLFTCISIGVTIDIIFAIAAQFVAEDIIALFTCDWIVIVLGASYLRSYIFDCVIGCIHFCFAGYFVASGHSLISFIQNIASIVCIRIPGAYLASVYFPNTLFPMGLAAPLGGLLQISIFVFFYVYFRKHARI